MIGVTVGGFALYKAVSYLSTTTVVKSYVGGLKSAWAKLTYAYHANTFKVPIALTVLMDNKVSNTEVQYSLHGLKEDVVATKARMVELKTSLSGVLTEEFFGDATVDVPDIVEKLTTSGFLTKTHHKMLSKYSIDADILHTHQFSPEQLSQVKQTMLENCILRKDVI